MAFKETLDLAYAKLALNDWINSLNDPDVAESLRGIDSRPRPTLLKIQYDEAVIRALRAAWGYDEFDLVLTLLDSRELGYLVWRGALEADERRHGVVVQAS